MFDAITLLLPLRLFSPFSCLFIYAVTLLFLRRHDTPHVTRHLMALLALLLLRCLPHAAHAMRERLLYLLMHTFDMLSFRCCYHCYLLRAH